jgi:Phage integrase, N-terminal SAM-like domain
VRLPLEAERHDAIEQMRITHLRTNRRLREVFHLCELRIRVRQYSRTTEKSYLDWVKRFILFHGKRQAAEMGKREIEAFLTHLAETRD